MKVDIINMDKFIKDNDLKEVKNPVYFNTGQVPTEDGLFSYEIFGIPGSEERKKQFAYINLNGYFLNPLVYKTLISMDRKIEGLVSGSKYYKINEKGELEEDDENGDTGLTFLYKNFKKLKFKDTDSQRRSEKLGFIEKLDINEIFMDKYPVIPAFLRDFNNRGASTREVDEVNDKYAKIIRIANTLDKDSNISLDFYSNNMKYTLQKTLVDIYDYFMQKIAHKDGLMHQGLMGKTVDYASRMVISTQTVRTNSWKDLSIKFGYTGIPLAQVCVLFLPFFIKEIHDFLDMHMEEISNVTDKKGNNIHIDDVKEQYTDDKIKKIIKSYIKSTEERFDELHIKDKQGNEYPIQVFKDKLKRNFTIIDLLYICATEIIKDKYVYITRYPIVCNVSL